MLRPLTIGSWQKARGRGCNAGEVCARRLFFLLCQVALGKAPGVYTQRSVYARRRIRLRDTWRSRSSAFLNSKQLCPLFFLKYSFRRAMLQLEFRESKSKPEESHFEFEQSQRHRRYVACTGGGDDVWTLTTHETRLSRDVQLWPIFLLKYSLRPAMLQLEFI